MIGAAGSGTKKNSAGGSGDLIRNFAKENPEFLKMSGSQRSKMMMELKQHAMQEERLMKGNTGFHLPGTKNAENGQYSESTRAAMQQMMEQKLKKRMLKITEVKPVWFTGGKIDKAGKIYDEQGYKIGEISKNNKIKIAGKELGQYDNQGSSTSMIKKKVLEYNRSTYHKSNNHGSFWGGGSASGDSGADSWFFGSKKSDDSSGGGFWG
jgi:hypothetical protein